MYSIYNRAKQFRGGNDAMNGMIKNVTRNNNSVCVRITEIDDIQSTLNDVNDYLLINKLQPIASPYLVKTKNDEIPCIEIYVDVCTRNT